ncbi:HAMP domain-containing histidine kinase [Solihabitans fulvus]|uniref:histidine kinase n=1 Tax=Solihabitans fulvus TaxID=1892852 RepID=A0A5B2XS73_9PSEU|nr:HAMP domain-containing sensor histidine kinase [Solihabitans fulvus]KAA2265744.1 HAMP domain-containing histidine kinase [Solihabitans fulvus]
MPRPAPSTPATSAAEADIRAAARTLGAQTAAMVAVAVVLLTAIAMWITTNAQRDTDHQLVTATAAIADDVIDPPPRAWEVIRAPSGALASTPGMPAGLPDRAALDAAAAGDPAIERDVRLPSGHFLVRTQDRANDTVQIVLDLGPSDSQRADLLTALAQAAAGGLLFAAVTGVLLARRVLAPLRRTLRLQRQFVADASHELRAPVTLLHTRAQLLDRALHRDPTTENLHDEATGLVRDSANFVDLVDDLLATARPTADSAVTDLWPVARDTVAAATPHATQRGLRLHTVHDDHPAPVLAAPAALRRALTALVDNAIEHTPPGGTITVAVAHTRTRALLRVTDTGCGFDTADPDLGTRFHTTAPPTGRPRYGLGLALVSDIADRYGGHLDVRSTLGEGSTVTITLPLHRRRLQPPWRRTTSSH